MIKLTRVPDFRDRLSECINANRFRAAEWGQHDCALWAATAVHATTGEDFAADIRGTYSTPEGAFKTIKKYYKADNVKQIFTDRFEEVHVAFARAGDLVYKNSNLYGFNVAMGVCNGHWSYFVLEDEGGLIALPTLELDGAFRVG